MTQNRPAPHWVVLGIVVVVVLVAVVLVVIDEGSVTLDPATPEGVVQRYVEAVLDGDGEAAARHLTDRAQVECSRIERRDEMRVSLLAATDHGDTADVDVLIDVVAGGLLGIDEGQMEARFDLRRVNDRWMIDFAPWQLQICFPPPEEVTP